MGAGSTILTETFPGTNGQSWSAGSSGPYTWTSTSSTGTVVDVDTNHGRIRTTGTALAGYLDYGVALFDMGTLSRDYELAGEFQWGATTEQYLDIGFRRDTGVSTGAGDSPATGYTLEMQPGVANGWWLARWEASVNTTPATGSALNMAAATAYAFRVRCVGHKIKARVWAGTLSSGEPTTWPIDWVDDFYPEDMSTKHYISFGCIGGASQGMNMWYDNLTVRYYAEPAISVLGNTSATSAATTTALNATTTAFPQVGDVIVVQGARDNALNDPATGDSAADNATTPNTYTRLGALASPSGTSTAAAGEVGVLLSAPVTTAWDSTHKTVTWTHPSVAARELVVYWISCTTGYRASSIGTGGSTAGAPSATTGAGTPQTDDLVLGAVAYESSGSQTETADADTTNGAWVTPITRFFTGSSTNATTALTHAKAISQFKIPTAAGTQTYDSANSVTLNVDAVALIAAFITAAPTVVASTTPNLSRYLFVRAMHRAAIW